MLMKCLVSMSLILVGSFAFAAADEVPAEFTATGRQCHDGDTCDVLFQGRDLKIRFNGIDAPELIQKMGPQARAFTEAFVVGKKLVLNCSSVSFERLVCTVYQAGRNINSEIVRHGWAFDFPRFSRGQYRSLEENARKRGLGIWGGDERRVISPFCFRHEDHRQCRVDKLFMP